MLKPLSAEGSEESLSYDDLAREREGICDAEVLPYLFPHGHAVLEPFVRKRQSRPTPGEALRTVKGLRRHGFEFTQG